MSIRGQIRSHPRWLKLCLWKLNLPDTGICNIIPGDVLVPSPLVLDCLLLTELRIYCVCHFVLFVSFVLTCIRADTFYVKACQFSSQPMSLFCHSLYFQVCRRDPSQKSRFVRVLLSMLQSPSAAVSYEAAWTLVSLSGAPTAIRAVRAVRVFHEPSPP